MNDYDDYEEDYQHQQQLHNNHAHLDASIDEQEPLFLPEDEAALLQSDVDFDDPEVSALPRILLMGPRRGGKTSIQVG